MNKKKKLSIQQNRDEQKITDANRTVKSIEQDAKKMAMVMQLVCW